MAAELFSAGGGEVAIALIPGEAGVFKVALDGNIVFDKAEAGSFPDLPVAKQLKKQLAEMLAAVPVGGDD
jgi:selenoprotein W-related protein